MTKQDQEELERVAEGINALNDITIDQIPNVVRDFLRGFLAPTRRTNPLGQGLAEGLLRPMVELEDEAVFVAIGRGMKARYEAERQAG